MTRGVFESEAALRSTLANHFGFLSGYGFGEPVVEPDQQGGWRVFYGSTEDVGIEMRVNPDLDALWTYLVAPKRRHRCSLDSLANVPSEPASWTREGVDERFAAEARALASVRDALEGDFSMYLDRAL